MKILLDIKEEKVGFVMELLNNFKFVKTKPLSAQSAEILQDINEAVKEMKDVKTGKKQSKPLADFLNEL